MKKLIVVIATIALLIPIAGCQEFDSTLAPIEDVTIEISEPNPTSDVTARITYGLPDGCYVFDSTRVVEITDGFDIGVWIKKPVGSEACDTVYRQETVTVKLGKKLEPGQSYNVRVNGVDNRVTVPTGTGGNGETIIKAAPIVSTDIRIAESFPPQVFIDIRGILTDGCTTLRDPEIKRQGNIIDINITTQRPAEAVCIQVISYFNIAVPLGSDFTAGQTYTLRVNGKSQEFNVDGSVSPTTTREPLPTVPNTGGSSGGSSNPSPPILPDAK